MRSRLLFVSASVCSRFSHSLPPPCVNMHEDLGVINSGGVHVVPLPFTISAQNVFNGLIMKRITSPTANYKFLKGERGERKPSLRRVKFVWGSRVPHHAPDAHARDGEGKPADQVNG